MAEALAPVRDPLALWLAPGPAAAPRDVLAAIAAGAVPPGAPDPAPAWLRPGQVRAFRTLLTILRRHGGAMLAAPVGTGKTFIALAAARTFGGGAVAVVPATLRPQWMRHAADTATDLAVLSHEELSRGRSIPAGRGLVIVDESHRFRNPSTRRYHHLAPALVGRPVALLTATPVVNHARELADQLLLGIRDDALAASGVASLRQTLGAGRGHPALAEAIVTRGAIGGLPALRREAPRWEGGPDLDRRLAAVDELDLSRDPAIANLIRSVLHAAAGSSPAAWSAALRRYRALLSQAADARLAGRALGRRELRAFAGAVPDQTVLWSLFDDGHDAELAVEDLDAVTALASAAPGDDDRKLALLGDVLADGRRTIVFTTFVATVRYLRERLGPRVAWCTGQAAGLGHSRVSREAVFGWFRPDAPDGVARTLVCTDLAAEGLDLQGAERVVHYDLPWTPMRLHQREGRAARLGARADVVEVVTLLPPAELERRERRTGRLRLKTRRVVRTGITGLGPEGWGWRHGLALDEDEDGAWGRSAVVRSIEPRMLVGLEVVSTGGAAVERLGAALGVVDACGNWNEDAETVRRAVAEARAADPRDARAGEWAPWIERLVPHARAILQRATADRWATAGLRPGNPALGERLRSLARDAARRRDLAALARVERGAAFAARGHTAGEAALAERLRSLGDGELLAALARIPAGRPEPPPPQLRMIGMVLLTVSGER